MAQRKFSKVDENKTNLLLEVIADAKSIGLDFIKESNFPIETVVYKRNSKRFIATCSLRTVNGKQIFTISFSSFYDRLNAQCAKTVLMHELIHSLPNCFNHGKEFKKYARLVNNNLSNYNVDTACRGNELERVNAIIANKIDDDNTSTNSGVYKKHLANYIPTSTTKQLYKQYSIDDCLSLIFNSYGKLKKTVVVKLIRYQLDNNDPKFLYYIFNNYPDVWRIVLMNLPNKYLNKIKSLC